MVAVQADVESRLDVMNFLNEISIDHPAALSFASGRPAEAYFDLAGWLGRIDGFVTRRAHERGIGAAELRAELAQYGRTNGLINDLIARQVGYDEGIDCQGEQVVVTAGCQEALALAITALCPARGDVLLVRSPTYIGATGIAGLHGVELAAVSAGDAGFVDALAAQVAALQARGKRPRALYLIPEFDNPTGGVLALAAREQLLALCARHQIVVLEDNPYGMFRFEGERVPPLYALDPRGCVVYLGTYSKTLCPALRVGFAIVPARLFGDAARAAQLLARLSKAKSFLTVNTSQVMQALVGGVLLAEQCSLARLIAPALAHYRANRDAMLAALARQFAACGGAVRWNRPEGGFFLSLELPFEFGADDVERCAREHQVLVMPMAFFALDRGHDRCVRLAFSNLDPPRIEAGVARFAAYVRSRLGRG